MSLLRDPKLEALLDRLHARSAEQNEALTTYFTTRAREGTVDFMLIDIWTPMARPALELVSPALRPGAIVVADNTAQFRDAYADYFAFVNDPRNRLRTLTLPFEGGFELSVRA